MKRRMKEYVFRMVAVFAVTSLVACDSREEVSGGRPLCISNASTGIVTTVTRATATRELTDATDAIGIFLQEGNGYEAIANSKYSYWTPYWITDGEYLILGTKAASMVAYYPYDRNQTTPIATLNPRMYRPEAELYYQTFQASYMTPAVRLSLKRAYALIRFSLIRGEADVPQAGDGAYQGDGKVTAFECAARLVKDGKLDLFTDRLTGTAEQTTLRSEAPDIPFDIGSNTASGQKDFLVVPTPAYSGDLTFTAVVDGKTMRGKVPASDLCGVEGALKAGTMYEIKVSVRPTALTVSGISQEAWDVTEMPGELEVK